MFTAVPSMSTWELIGSGLVADIEEYWDGQADPMASFEIGEFRDETHRVLVMIVEGC